MITATGAEKSQVASIVGELICVITILFISQNLSFGTVYDNKSLSDCLIVNAAFQQTLWSVAPICSGGEAAQGKLDFSLLCTNDVIGQSQTMKMIMKPSFVWYTNFDIMSRRLVSQVPCDVSFSSDYVS